jgi:hypothetical protein
MEKVFIQTGFSYEVMCQDVLSIAMPINWKSFYVGHSMGGKLAIFAINILKK